MPLASPSTGPVLSRPVRLDDNNSNESAMRIDPRLMAKWCRVHGTQKHLRNATALTDFAFVNNVTALAGGYDS
jgi:hypothetical protein